MSSLSTPNVNGRFDYGSNLIELDRYDSRHKAFIEQALRFPKASIDKDYHSVQKVRAYALHEVTHFIDFTTTLWGVEYIARKSALLGKLISGADFQQALDVFMLNASEIEMHDDLKEGDGSIELLSCDVVSHAVMYDKAHGGYIYICFLNKGEIVYKTPVSMLSVIESNAFSNEFIGLLVDLEKVEDVVGREIEKQRIERELNGYLDSPEFSEYTVFIYLAKKHFSCFDLKDVLSLVSSLCRFSMSISTVDMAKMANILEGSFKEQVVGNQICMDMRRGGCRHVLCFKTLLFLYGWVEEMSGSMRESLLDNLRRRPFDTICLLWKERFNVDVIWSLAELEFGVMCRSIKESSILLDHYMVEESKKANGGVSSRIPPGMIGIERLKAPNILLGDCEEVKLPNGFDMSSMCYFDENIDKFIKINQAYSTKKACKFHMGLEQAWLSRYSL